jgi:hypothetical protein
MAHTDFPPTARAGHRSSGFWLVAGCTELGLGSYRIKQSESKSAWQIPASYEQGPGDVAGSGDLQRVGIGRLASIVGHCDGQSASQGSDRSNRTMFQVDGAAAEASLHGQFIWPCHHGR